MGLEAEVGEADDFALVHRDGAEDLGEIFPQPNARQELFGLAEAAVLLHALRVSRHFLDRFDIGRKPRQPVDGVLFGLDLVGAQLAVFAHPLAHGVDARNPSGPAAAKWAWRARSSSVTGSPLFEMGGDCCAAACVANCAVAMRLLASWRWDFGLARVALGAAPGQNGRSATGGSSEGEWALQIIWQAAEKFAADDGWAIASYIGLTLLTSLFPFLIFVAAVAGFFGSQRPRA